MTTTRPYAAHAHRLHATVSRATAGAYTRLHGALSGERGDLPGWVLITVMTAALVTMIWAFAGDTLVSMFQDAINNVAP